MSFSRILFLWHWLIHEQMLQHNEDCKLEFVEEWKVAGADLPYPEHIKDFRPCDEGSPLMLEASSSCGILTDPTGKQRLQESTDKYKNMHNVMAHIWMLM